MMYLQPPVGNKTKLGHPGSGPAGFASLENWRPSWFASGTAALAAAVMAAIQLRPTKKPLAIMPAYSCPDLVAATRFAGAEPCFVDLEPGSLRMDLNALGVALKGRPAVVTVIGVDLFGLPERWHEIGRLCDQYNVVCIRDCAQSLQSPGLIDGDAESDIRIYSFGRGKPLFLQGGGAALVASQCNQQLSQCFDQTIRQLPIRRQSVSRLANRLYNIALHPQVYFLLPLILGDRIGETRYRPLETLESLQEGFDVIANHAIQGFWEEFDNKQAEILRLLAEVCEADGAPLAFLDGDGPLDCRLLRMPLLMRSGTQRDVCIEKLRKKGIRATSMYARALPAIEGVRADVDINRFPVAVDIAQRLMTLPVHAGLRARDLRVIEDTLVELTPA